jgi:hypothetical protein
MNPSNLKSFRLIATAGVLAFFALSAQAALQAPKSVSGALRILNQVVGHTGRLVAAKDYPHVGGEHGEFTEGAAMLREAIRGEPAEFAAKVEAALTRAIDASAALGKIATGGDAEKTAAAHAEFAAKVKDVIELFPEDVRPKPRPAKG